MKKVIITLALAGLLFTGCRSPRKLKIGDTFHVDWSYSTHDFQVVKMTPTGVITNSTNTVVEGEFFSFHDLENAPDYVFLEEGKCTER